MRTLALLLVLVLAPFALADVIVVDKSGTGDFTDVAPAVTAAASGDIVVIHHGNYADPNDSIVVSEKGLVLVGESGGDVILPPLFIQEVPAGETFVVRGVTVVPTALVGFFGATVTAGNSEGVVILEDCVIEGLDGGPGFQGLTASDGLPGLAAFQADVSVNRCTITGGVGTDTNAIPFPLGQQVTSDGAHAIDVIESRVSIARTTATGGDGGDDVVLGVPGGDAGEGLRAVRSMLLLSGSDLIGGTAGTGTPPGRSATALHASGPGTSVKEIDSSFTGGPGTDDLVVLDGPTVHWAGASAEMRLPAPLSSGEAGTIEVSAPPGSKFSVFFSFAGAYVPVTKFRGPFTLGDPFFGPLLIDFVPASGTYSLPFVAPSLAGTGVDGIANYSQVISNQDDDGLVLSSTSVYVQVEPGS